MTVRALAVPEHIAARVDLVAQEYDRLQDVEPRRTRHPVGPRGAAPAPWRGDEPGARGSRRGDQRPDQRGALVIRLCSWCGVRLPPLCSCREPEPPDGDREPDERVSHGICVECAREHFPNHADGLLPAEVENHG